MNPQSAEGALTTAKRQWGAPVPAWSDRALAGLVAILALGFGMKALWLTVEQSAGPIAAWWSLSIALALLWAFLVLLYRLRIAQMPVTTPKAVEAAAAPLTIPALLTTASAIVGGQVRLSPLRTIMATTAVGMLLGLRPRLAVGLMSTLRRLV